MSDKAGYPVWNIVILTNKNYSWNIYRLNTITFSHFNLSLKKETNIDETSRQIIYDLHTHQYSIAHFN